jgi:hypothetical protein
MFCGLGAAEDSGIEDYYTKARGFPIIYSANDDPEVLEDMRAAVAELASGTGSDENFSGSDSESLDSENSENGEEADWEDEEDEDKTPAKKHTIKILSCVDKVRHG